MSADNRAGGESEVAERHARNASLLHLLSDSTARLLAGEDPDLDVLPALFAQLSTELAVDAAFGFVVAGEGRLELAFHHGLDPALIQDCRTIDFGQGVCGTVAATWSALHVADADQSNSPRDAFLKRAGIRAFACEPLIAAGRLLGTQSFGSRTRERFEEDELSFFQAVARHVALARLRAEEERERRATETELAASEGFLRSVLEASPDCIKVMELDGTLAFINPNGLCLMEIDDFEALKGAEWASFWPGASARDVRGAVERARYGLTTRFEAFCPTAKGSPRWWDVTVSPARGARGKVQRIVSVSRDVTERRRDRDALAESARRLNLALEASAVGLWSWDPATGRVEWSPETYAIHGFRRGEFDGTAEAFGRTLHPDDAERVWATVNAAVANRTRYECEFRIFRADGEVRWVRNVGRGVYDADGRVLQMLGTIGDVTERKQAEMALRDSEANLRRSEALLASVLAATDGVIFAKDVDGRYLLANEATARVLGRTVDEVVGRTDAELLDPKTAAELRANDRMVMRRNRRLEKDEAMPVEGGIGVFRTIKSPLRDPDGTVIGVVGASMDVTQSRLAEEAVRSSEARLRAVFENAAAGIARVSADHRFLEVNDRYCEIAGWSREELLARTVADVTHPDDVADDLARGDAVARGEAAFFTKEKRYRRKDGGEAWVVLSVSAVRTPDGRLDHFVAVIEDAGDRKRAEAALREREEELRRLNATLEARVRRRTDSLRRANARLLTEVERRETAQAALVQAQKLEAVGQLTSGVAHDFNNLIQAIGGGFTLIERRTRDPRVLEIARHGAKAARRGAGLVKQLMAFARQQVLEPRTVDLCALTTEAEPLLRNSVGSAVRLTVGCDADLWPVRVDPVQLETALINLAINARDAMPDGGSLRVRVLNCPADAGDRPPELEGVEAVEIRVADSGFGMAPDVLERVVEPFFTTKEPGKGTGLGLAMVYGFVRQSGGAFRIDSEAGRGTTVSLFLPRAPADAVAEPDSQTAPSGEPRAHERATLVVVDDDAQVLAVTAATLRDLGYEVLEAGGVDEAMALPDLDRAEGVVTDVVMPDGGGVALAERLRATRPDLQILFLTGHADRASLDGERMLDKPHHPDALAAAVLELLDERPAVRERGPGPTVLQAG